MYSNPKGLRVGSRMESYLSPQDHRDMPMIDTGRDNRAWLSGMREVE